MELGWIGTGIMGVPMCTNLIRQGHKLYVFNRSKERTTELINIGAVWCDSPEEIAQLCEVVFVMVGTPKDVENVILSSKGVLIGSKRGSTIVDMTTSSPDLAKIIYEKANMNGISFLDAPVSGGDIGAEEGTLAIMVGGKESSFQQNLHLFEIIGSNITYMGSAGSGQHAKLANQILVAGTMMGVVESLMYAQKAGMDLNKIIDILNKGAASSWSINVLGRKIARRDFEPGFLIKHFVKDMGIALTEADRMHVCLPGLSIVRQFYVSAMAMGDGNLGIQGLYKVLERLNQSY